MRLLLFCILAVFLSLATAPHLMGPDGMDHDAMATQYMQVCDACPEARVDDHTMAHGGDCVHGIGCGALLVADLPPALPDTARHTARHARPESKCLWGTSQMIDLPPPRLHT